MTNPIQLKNRFLRARIVEIVGDRFRSRLNEWSVVQIQLARAFSDFEDEVRFCEIEMMMRELGRFENIGPVRLDIE